MDRSGEWRDDDVSDEEDELRQIQEDAVSILCLSEESDTSQGLLVLQQKMLRDALRECHRDSSRLGPSCKM